MKLEVYNARGEKKHEVEIKKHLEPKREETLFQAVDYARQMTRKGNAQVKTRGSVSGGGRKPWRQKGTGRARQGSIRAPHWRGGGVVHGPARRPHQPKINRRVKISSLIDVFFSKVAAGEVKIIDQFPKFSKTKEFAQVLSKLGLASSSCLLLTSDASIISAARNLRGVKTLDQKNLGLLDLISQPQVLVNEEEFNRLIERLGLRL